MQNKRVIDDDEVVYKVFFDESSKLDSMMSSFFNKIERIYTT